MQVFKTKWFARFARQELIADAGLREAIARLRSVSSMQILAAVSSSSALHGKEKDDPADIAQ
jgi:hypothetical protein